ncbi:MAG TPA: alternative ribosome rescue aminoacyl-tRNA hydrolase ArfB [Egibacteraceae bacterium]|nr:alternative ribosome rescue aminoacyl-tRNA hydrolase ArfB [Egibacteraceae bacterium]
MAGVRISRTLSIPQEEIELSFARSGGPGGQHVNTSATKVELRFDVARSPSLSDEQRRLLLERLSSRLTNDGVLVLHAGGHRSQTRNREAAVERFAGLLREGLKKRRPRTPTRPSRASKQRRLDEKKQHGEKKRLRRAPDA